MNQFKVAIFIVMSIMAFACTKDIEIGADLLDDENITVEFTDTLSITAKTVNGDSAVSFFESLFFDKRTHMIGQMDDPLFGRSEAIVYTNASLGLSITNFEENATLDSIVLVVPFDSLGTYGPDGNSFDVEVFQTEMSLRSIVDGQDTIFSNEGFTYNTILGSATVVPNFVDSIDLSIPNGDTIVETRVPKQLRIVLDPSFGETLLTDTSITSSDTLLQEYIKGLVLKTNTGNGFIGLDLLPGAGATLGLFYTTVDDAKRLFSFEVGRIRHNELIHDYMGSQVEQALLGPDPDNLLYVQGMAGTNISFDLASVLNIKDKLINKVELEMVLAEIPDIELNDFPAIGNMIAAYENEDGDLAFTSDINILNTLLGRNPSLDELISAFGGKLELDEDDNLMKYSFNITNHVLNIIDGDVETTEMVILSYVKQQRPNRSVIYGPEHSDDNLKAKLKLILSSP